MTRLRNLRRSKIIRDSLGHHHVECRQLIYPLFITHGHGVKKEISTLPSQYIYSPDVLLKEMEKFVDLGLNKFLLFGEAHKKDFLGTGAYDSDGPLATTIRWLKEVFGDSIFLISDVCLCPYTSHGHCGIPDKTTSEIKNDESISLIAKSALTFAEAGSDWVAPSDMMDFRVGAIRETLDANGLTNTGILSYSVKFASAYYGPFRGAIDSSPQFGDRSTYQMDPRDIRQVSREISQDIAEGADAVMVKPALAYLDVIKTVRSLTDLPVAAYNVSGEYTMVKESASKGLVEERGIVLENLNSMVRAGADWVITYHARELLERNWLE